MQRLLFLVLFVCVVNSNIVFAHEGKHENKTTKQDTITLVGKDTIAVNGMAVGKAINNEEPVETQEPEFILKPGEQMLAHLHNKIVHFPIALTLVAFLFSLLNIKKSNYDLVIKILLALSLGSAIAAFFTGNTQLVPFIGDPKEWLAYTHRLSGIITTIFILTWFIALFIERTKKSAWVIGLIVVIGISITGFLGGVLAH
ncbi:MAG: hypothetical protein KJ666_01245 [Bacteroidetes bacterium]|nr:hypothetical protein [Bacteroidota bacterium]